MTTLLFTFVAALMCALSITPLVRKVALRYNLVAEPSERCTHTRPMPRVGGIALFVSFTLALVLTLPFQTDISRLLHDSRILVLFLGALIIFLLGLTDDIRHLSPRVKFLVQILVGALTWYGGIQINVLSVSLTGGAELGWLSLPITIFWIVLVTNAINLIDGLDGLAAGICLCAALLMLLLCTTTQKYLIALFFAAMSGSLLGFLRYNFNPASIFMGDCGSYFLGYTFAALSILGSLKGQTTAAMLIPFIVLGVPLFDAIISPVRRFARGKKMFSPDQKHLHHRLLEEGHSQRTTVLVLYGATLILGSMAFLLTLVRDEQAGLILFIPFIALLIAFKKLGYLHYLAVDKVYGWLTDMTETSRISADSRTFLDHQITIKDAASIDEVWTSLEQAFLFLDLDTVLLKVNQPGANDPVELQWENPSRTTERETRHQFRMDFPLIQRNGTEKKMLSAPDNHLGQLSVSKDVTTNPIRQFTIRRIEQLKRDLVDKLWELRASGP